MEHKGEQRAAPALVKQAELAALLDDSDDAAYAAWASGTSRPPPPSSLEQAADRADAHDAALAEWAVGDESVPPPVRAADEEAERLPLAEVFAGMLVPWTQEEFDAAREPEPHAFERGNVGLFPIGEVSVAAAAGREGKTTNIVGIATALAMAHSLAELWPRRDRCVVIYSAEDSRRQYARKFAAQASLLPEAQAKLVMERVLVPDLENEAFAPMRALVRMAEGAPYATSTVTAIIEALRPIMASAVPIGLLVVETASTVSEADETNTGLRILVDALKRIGRALQVSVLLSHHVNQASLVKLPDLDISTEDFRGGTALIGNARQTAMVVNLGSDDNPLPANDARTILRSLAAPGETGRVSAFITLDSSKGIDPPPVFFRWVQTDFGPAAVEVPAPPALAGKHWKLVHQMIRAARAEARKEEREDRAAEKKDATRQEHMRAVLRALAEMERETPDKPATERQIRERARLNSANAGQALAAAEAQGVVERYPARAGGKDTNAYRLKGGGTDER
ncbi:AAA family ATPase [Luteimonas marina]|uniref:AAA family ATPase n=1 Tax=Luteimonas marina TaxID=488485 RepID=UPI0011B479B6|nr:AAA family ATPase [Luteimonas marina]